MIQVNDTNFNTEVLEYKGIVLVDFYADWCGPCKNFAPIFEEFSKEVSDVKCVKVNVDESTSARTYKVMSIPTVILFKDGEVCDRFIGAMQKKDLSDFVNKNR
ncbi:thioredoxin [Candidatus Arthromitus sp. SFB-rat-Yit]|uniref:thioredoxin n=1 Tax=Candidatus Arthromitus sp. SFB-rat-Yit TaxID=1041504 RepID=UPI000227A787|nr:thioredoxin [Candidatus Arthromitus sp. SFB-rat-Yit]BAK81747.1 thioredoxin [Candidatus Arthromitus sp. SFB-rat-Yit]